LRAKNAQKSSVIFHEISFVFLWILPPISKKVGKNTQKIHQKMCISLESVEKDGKKSVDIDNFCDIILL